ncbi:hypothetical protein GE09DRAFT_713928 [Coniochaeta sp. 2T2.1]|nr:hypothetical protein GE09DRAFT_713928 [Coniochaeta sp. 2T2.1]
MAETVAESGYLSLEDDTNFLEIDFEDADGALLDTNELKPTGGEQEPPAVAKDIDFHLNEFEVVDDAGEQSGHGNDVALSGDLTTVQLTVPPTETAESEIGYDDDVSLHGDSTGRELAAAAQEQGHDDDAALTDNADEIDYDHGDLEQDPEQENNAAESHAALEASEEQDRVASEVLDQQVLGNTSVHADSTVARLEADASTHEPSEIGEQEFEENDSASHAAYPDDSTNAMSGGEVSDVIVTYNGAKYELCASVHNEDPETYFFAGSSEMDLPLSDIFGLLRNVIKDEIEPSDGLMIRVPQLKLEFGEVCLPAHGFVPGCGADLGQGSDKEFINKHTFRNILDLFRRLKYNDGEDADQAQLVVQLVAKPDCRERHAMLIEAADAGRGWSELFDESDASVISTGEHSHEGLDEQQVDFDFGDQYGGNADDMQHDAVEIIEEAYFYDDTNDAVDHDTDNMFGQVTEDQGHNAEDEDELHEEYDLDGELLENDDFDAEEEKVDDTMGDAHVDGAAPQTYFDDGSGSTSHDRTGSELFADASDAGNGDAAGTAGDGGLDSFDDQAASALGASNALESAHQEPAIQHDAGVETAHDPAAHDDFEDGDGGDFAVNEDSIDIEGFTAFDETASNEPPTGEQIQVPGSHGTSSTSTVDGDEITYEDENVAVGDTTNGTLEVGDVTAGNVDEIDWEHDGAEDVAAAEEPTNVSSPSGLSIKRGREADDLGSLDDENAPEDLSPLG